MSRPRHPRATRCESRSSAPARPASTPPRPCSSIPRSTSRSTCSTASRPRSAWFAPASPPTIPKIKNVIRRYEKTAGHEAFRFFGNVERRHRRQRGRARIDLPRRDLGLRGRAPTASSASPARTCPARTRPPSSSPGTTAIPTSPDREFDLYCERVVVIGNGNVAADVARMLVLPARSSRRPTPPTTRSRRSPTSAVEEVVILGRRGPAQAAFTNPEVRELGELVDADVEVDPDAVDLDEASRALPRVRVRPT